MHLSCSWLANTHMTIRTAKLWRCHSNDACACVPFAAETLRIRAESDQQQWHQAGNRANPSQHRVGEPTQGGPAAVVPKRSRFLELIGSSPSSWTRKEPAGQCLTHFIRDVRSVAFFSADKSKAFRTSPKRVKTIVPMYLNDFFLCVSTSCCDICTWCFQSTLFIFLLCFEVNIFIFSTIKWLYFLQWK